MASCFSYVATEEWRLRRLSELQVKKGDGLENTFGKWNNLRSDIHTFRHHSRRRVRQ